MIKFVHISDTHIGLTRFNKTNESGHNVRGEDFLKSFKSSIDNIIKLKPDFIIHSGDLFESVVVADRYIYEVQKILSNVDCPIIITSGNHDSPKSISAINPILLLEILPNVKIIDKKYERLDLKINNKSISIHAVPHIVNSELFIETCNNVSINKSSEYNIAITHGALPFGNYKYVEDGHIIPESFINKEFDYIALGDYHITKKIHDRCYYSGGTDIFKSSEISDKNYLEVILDGKNINVKEISIKVRSCHNIKIDLLNEENNSLEYIYSKLIEKSKSIGEKIKDSIIFLDLINIDCSISDLLDKNEINNIFKGCFFVRSKIKTIDRTKNNSETAFESIGNIIDEWKEFSKKDKEIQDLGLHYLNESLEFKE